MKKKIRKTGEIVDVICYSGGADRYANDSVSFIDSNGNEKCEKGMNYYWDLEDIEDEVKLKYWEHLRNKAALKIFAAKLSNHLHGDITEEISLSVHYANHLVNELIKNKLKIKNDNGEERMQINESV